MRSLHHYRDDSQCEVASTRQLHCSPVQDDDFQTGSDKKKGKKDASDAEDEVYVLPCIDQYSALLFYFAPPPPPLVSLVWASLSRTVLCRVVVSRHFGKPKVKDAEQDRKLKEFGFSDSDDETPAPAPAPGQASAIVNKLSMNCAVHLSLTEKNSLEKCPRIVMRSRAISHFR
jgi:hypothetical protein